MIGLIKKLIPEGLKRQLIALREKIRYWLLWLFSRNRFLSSLYYCLFSARFGREHQAVLRGRLKYMASLGMGECSNTLLRRNIHRIEKGLIMEPRKSIFALDYIEQTVDGFVRACINDSHDKTELKWAKDVLSEYFSVVDVTRINGQLKGRFEQACLHFASDGQSIPYLFSQRTKADVSAQQFHRLCMQRRSVRWFEQRPVDKALLEQAVTMAATAPSACNRQPFQFHISENQHSAQMFLEVAAGTKGFAQNVPCAIVVTADLSFYPTEKDRHLVYIDSSLAAMQLMLALETLGLSSCPINFPDIEAREAKMAQLLGLEPHIRPVMLIAVGFGRDDGKIPYSHKKSKADLIRYVKLI